MNSKSLLYPYIHLNPEYQKRTISAFRICVGRPFTVLVVEAMAPKGSRKANSKAKAAVQVPKSKALDAGLKSKSYSALRSVLYSALRSVL